MSSQMQSTAAATPPEAKADYTLRIAPVTVELAPERILSTIGYNGASPGPVLRMREGKPITVDVINNTDIPELVHWHGLLIPADVDGVEEEATPFVPPQGRRRYQFTPAPRRFPLVPLPRHGHAPTCTEAPSPASSASFISIPAATPANTIRSIFLALRDWEPFFTSNMEDTDEEGQTDPQLEKPAVLNTDPNGLEVNSNTYSINDKSLGAGEPIRVKEGQRILFRLLNASAIENRRIALPGHKFKVIALDGNPVPSPQPVETLFLGAGERIDAIVEMNNPGVWILGATEDPIRAPASASSSSTPTSTASPSGSSPPRLRWDYTPSSALPQALSPPAPPTIPSTWPSKRSPAAPANSTPGSSTVSPTPTKTSSSSSRALATASSSATAPTTPTRCISIATSSSSPRSTASKTSGIIKDTVVVPYYGRASRRLHRRPAGPHPLSLPHPAAHGLRLQSALPLLLTTHSPFLIATLT